MVRGSSGDMDNGSGDALDRELASLKETIGLTNPLTFGHKGDWKTTTVWSRETALQEGAYAKTLPKSFVLTEPKTSLKAFQAAAAAAKAPTQPLRPSQTINENGSASASRKTPSNSEDDPCLLSLKRRELPPSSCGSIVKRVPIAKRSHMDGILHGIPGDKSPPNSTTHDSLEYSEEMKHMNRDKNTSFHRKRDAYSEYVEARARFSKMHSVN